jgi:hypothetical protein
MGIWFEFGGDVIKDNNVVCYFRIKKRKRGDPCITGNRFIVS